MKTKHSRPGARGGQRQAAALERSAYPAARRRGASRRGQARELQATIAHPRAIGGADLQSASPTPSRRRLGASRGGQPGNHNALRHGFYSAVFKESERRLLDQIPLTDLSAEIELIRVTNKRFLEALVASKGELDFDTQLTALRAVNLSAHSIATLLRAHALTSAIIRDAELMATPDSQHPAQDQVVKP